MTKLTDTQLIVLSKAAARADGAGVVPERLGKAAAGKVGSSLVIRKLMREIRTKPGMPGWRVDGDGRSYSLVITRAGRDAIGVDDDHNIDDAGVHEETSSSHDIDHVTIPVVAQLLQPVRDAEDTADPADERTAAKTYPSPRSGTKQALLIEMLQRSGGVTIAELMAATGWLSHTVRAALTGLRKRGLVIVRTKGEDRVTSYCIESEPAGNGNALQDATSVAKAA